MKVTHLAHSCVLLEVADTRILIDPGNLVPDFGVAHDLDAIVITHQHPDHLDRDRLPDLVRANPSARLLADPGSLPVLAELGLDAEGHAEGGTRIGEVSIAPVGSTHALIHDEIPRIPNVGVRVSAAGEPTAYHPGDSLAEDPGPVDLLLFPLSAPWQASREMTAFLRRFAARWGMPIHDGLLSPAGRPIYLGHAQNLGHPDTEILDPGLDSPIEVSLT